jgi:hypothetical protein
MKVELRSSWFVVECPDGEVGIGHSALYVGVKSFCEKGVRGEPPGCEVFRPQLVGFHSSSVTPKEVVGSEDGGGGSVFGSWGEDQPLWWVMNVG